MIKGESILKPHWNKDKEFSVYNPDLWSIWFRYLSFLKILFFEKNIKVEGNQGLGFPGIGFRI